MADPFPEPLFPGSQFDPKVPSYKSPFSGDRDLAGSDLSGRDEDFREFELPAKGLTPTFPAPRPAAAAPASLGEASGELPATIAGSAYPVGATSDGADSDGAVIPTPSPPAPARVQRSGIVRETIESIAIACVLAFLFKTFQAEAFVIPTGSMAQTLHGRHKDVQCPECGYRYPASASDEVDNTTGALNGPESNVVIATCPNCRFPLNVDPSDPINEGETSVRSYTGDRIWVSKVPYHLGEPTRWDVIVFRFPERAETYYIKRLIGLPNETVMIKYGDIYTKKPDETNFTLQRKPPDKVLAMSQVVHDNDYVARDLKALGWPERWQSIAPVGTRGAWQHNDETRSFTADGAAVQTWIRYQHVIPTEADWDAIANGRWDGNKEAKPQLITDFYAYNAFVLRKEKLSGLQPYSLGLNWVGDLLLDCQVDVRGQTGSALFDLVKAGRHHTCEIDVASGQLTLTIDDQPEWRRTASTSIRGPGRHRIRFANVDAQLLVWVDNKLVEFAEPATYEPAALESPRASAVDAADLMPLGIGSKSLAMEVSHLSVLRDVYYIATNKNKGFDAPRSDFSIRHPSMTALQVAEFNSTPSMWNGRIGNLFETRDHVTFPLGEDQFFVLGDNSPMSSDARLWTQQSFVERDLLIGKALFVYWPHPWDIDSGKYNLPVLPNVKGMGFIR